MTLVSFPDPSSPSEDRLRVILQAILAGVVWVVDGVWELMAEISMSAYAGLQFARFYKCFLPVCGARHSRFGPIVSGAACFQWGGLAGRPGDSSALVFLNETISMGYSICELTFQNVQPYLLPITNWSCRLYYVVPIDPCR